MKKGSPIDVSRPEGASCVIPLGICRLRTAHDSPAALPDPNGDLLPVLPEPFAGHCLAGYVITAPPTWPTHGPTTLKEHNQSPIFIVIGNVAVPEALTA